MTKKLHIKTYGCQMNVYDSQRMSDVLAPLGFVATETPEDADMVILNTCHIREKAAEKVYSELGRLRRMKDAKGGDMVLAVAGCVAQAEGEEMIRRAPYLDMVFGPQAYHKLPEMVAKAGRAAGTQLDTDFPPDAKFDHLPSIKSDDAPTQTLEGCTAFLTVQEGCDKFCTYCVVPYTRGAEFSRPVADVLAEAHALADKGAMELTLLGQNVNAYHGAVGEGGDWSLGKLIRAVADISGIERVRYMTSYPAEVDDDLIAAHRDVPQLMPFLHLPVQSGSDAVLQAMNRRHGADDYRRIVDKLRAARPDLALSSDFIVGFPGETDADFQATMTLVRDIGFASAYSFKFSARPGTPAADMPNTIDEAVQGARLTELQALLKEQQRAFNDASIGTTQPVLLDRRGRHPGQLLGRGPAMQAVAVDAPDALFGTLQDVRIESAGANSLQGVLAATDTDRKSA